MPLRKLKFPLTPHDPTRSPHLLLKPHLLPEGRVISLPNFLLIAVCWVADHTRPDNITENCLSRLACPHQQPTLDCIGIALSNRYSTIISNKGFLKETSIRGEEMTDGTECLRVWWGLAHHSARQILDLHYISF